MPTSSTEARQLRRRRRHTEVAPAALAVAAAAAADAAADAADTDAPNAAAVVTTAVDTAAVATAPVAIADANAVLGTPCLYPYSAPMPATLHRHRCRCDDAIAAEEADDAKRPTPMVALMLRGMDADAATPVP